MFQVQGPQLVAKLQFQLRNAADSSHILEECEVGSNIDRQKTFVGQHNGGYNQIWFIRQIRNGNMYQIGSKAKQDYNLEVYYSNKGSQTRIGKKQNNKDTQTWIIQQRSGGPNGLTYAFKNQSNGLYLTVKKSKNQVVIDEFHNDGTSLWYITPTNTPTNQNNSQGWGNQQQQGQGWGPQQGQMQGQGWGPQQGQMQGQGWGPQQGQMQGQGWGPNQQQQGQGWGPQQGQNWGPNQQQQGQGWGPQQGQMQGQGWGNQQQQGWGQQNMQPPSLFNQNIDYVITTALNDKMALDVSGNKADNNKLIIWKKHGKDNQCFKIKHQNGKYQLISKKGKAVEVVGGSSDKGAKLHANSLNNVPGQYWQMVPAKGQGDCYHIKSFCGHCMDVSGGKDKDGAQVIQWEYNGNKNQIWKIHPAK